MKTETFGICLNNEGYEVSLEKGKLYRVIDPLPNDPPDYLRVIDESGEDYLFDRERFFQVALPTEVANVLKAA